MPIQNQFHDSGLNYWVGNGFTWTKTPRCFYAAPVWPNERGSKQFHFDVAVDDISAAAQYCIELGAHRPVEQPGDTWVVLIDPAGHPFCLTDAANW